MNDQGSRWDTEVSAVGDTVRRVDGVEKVTGAARFTSDIVVPGMVHAAIVPSLHPSGEIEAIGFDDALSLEDVYGAISAQDLTEHPIGCRSIAYGPILRDQPILAERVVRFVGEPVAAVFAKDARRAREAADLVSVEIRPSPAAATLDEALAEDAPLVHAGRASRGEFSDSGAQSSEDTNICVAHTETKGDVEEGMAQADVVFEDEFEFPAVYQYAMEPHCAIAEANNRTVTVWSSCQHPHVVARDLARMFGYPLSAIRVIATYVGGGFGSKSFTHIEPLVVALSLAAGRPVKLALGVSEAMRISRRHNARAKVRTGVTKEGRLVAADIELLYDTGAYALTGPVVAKRGCLRALGGYDIPHYRVRSQAVYTNTSPAGSFRSIGAPQASWAVEGQLNRIARALEIDAFEIRRSNVAKAQSVFRPGRSPMDADLRKNLDALDRISRSVPDTAKSPAPWRRSKGIALAVTDPAAFGTSSAILKLAGDGSLTVLVGSSELGQGVRTVVAQVAAASLGIEMDNVRVLQTDTSYGPYDTSTGASRSTTMTGLAVQRAAEDLKRQSTTYVGELWGEEPNTLTIARGNIYSPSGRQLGVAEVVQSFFGQDGGNLIGVGYVTEHEFPESPPFWEIACGAAEIEIDTETGEIKVASYFGVSDLGRVINPATAKGQEVGAIVQGLGHSLFEMLVWEEGEPLVTSLVDYRVPRLGDIPPTFVVTSIEDGNGPGPFGAKGGGEGPIVPVAAAISSALEGALDIRINRLPMTPEGVWRVLQTQRQTSG